MFKNRISCNYEIDNGVKTATWPGEIAVNRQLKRNIKISFHLLNGFVSKTAEAYVTTEHKVTALVKSNNYSWPGLKNAWKGRAGVFFCLTSQRHQCTITTRKHVFGCSQLQVILVVIFPTAPPLIRTHATCRPDYFSSTSRAQSLAKSYDMLTRYFFF